MFRKSRTQASYYRSRTLWSSWVVRIRSRILSSAAGRSFCSHLSVSHARGIIHFSVNQPKLTSAGMQLPERRTSSNLHDATSLIASIRENTIEHTTRTNPARFLDLALAISLQYRLQTFCSLELSRIFRLSSMFLQA